MDSILAWLAEAGFELNPRAGGVDDYRQSPAMRGTSRERYVVLNLLWKPSDLGPKAVWDSIPLLWRSTLEGLMLTVDVEDGSRVRSIRVASWNKWRN